MNLLLLALLGLWIWLEIIPEGNSIQCVKQGNKVMEAPLTTPREWIDDAIKAHNKYRAIHGAGPLKFNLAVSPAWVKPSNISCLLCKSAQWTANTLIRTGFMHTTKMPEKYHMACGENLFMAAGQVRIFGHAPVDSWYSEEPDYDYETGTSKSPSLPIGHFTQLVWKAAREVCMVYVIKGDRYYAVAHYNPRGNVKKRYLENVGEKRPVVVHPLMELLCKKYSGSNPDGELSSVASRWFKCHYKGQAQLHADGSILIHEKKEPWNLNKVLGQDALVTYVKQTTANKSRR